ncbi:MAG: HDOD domain-containing protein [Candidatus Hydrogenedentes bacterium]|nr:HDOD domain-containing protein [Candidatus Hydrogenedentota bacterium]
MKHILFVDDEPNILEGLQRMLFPFQHEWRIGFASGGQEALDIMQREHFDVIVTDMRMPGMDGAKLLEIVKKRQPDAIRFVLTGQSDTATLYRTVGEAHQFLTKPCKPTLLKECVDRAFAIRDLLQSDSLRAVVSQIESLPPMPQTYAKLCEKLRSPDVSAKDVGLLMESDLAMTAKVLHLVNSAFFGFRQRVSSASQAVALLGFETIKALVLMTGLFSNVQERKLPSGFSFDRLWQHSLKVGSYAQMIALAESASKDSVNDAYTAGLLHDCGELVLAAACQEDFTHAYDYAMVNGVRQSEAEKELLGCTHAEIGAYLLGIWGLPHPIVEAVAYHHRPTEFIGAGFSPVTAVHVADALAWSNSVGNAEYPLPEVDHAYLAGLGMDGRYEAWRAACEALDSRGGG